MQIEKTPLKDCLLIKPTMFEDHRGLFLETYHRRRLADFSGIDAEFVQDNQSMSHYGVLRGLHYQKGEFAQTKIVRVIHGKVLDVVVDLRPDSPSFKKTFSVILDDENLIQLYVPKGFGHGFVTLSKRSVFAYKCDHYYTPGSEAGIRYNDPDLDIDWNFPEDQMILSDKDKELPFLKDVF
ncbi:dTDP-4-dehydrorhamnose 3,5-epimerase [uncultured Christiangramia sp.]|uniref:dTDP-4-dehydrorhamnose 3,5-epimerase n=1 Tax=Christiangramia sp. 3-2217-3z TaxID=3417564 RepID=UPI0026396981|nr:dTDP-4-dehydrorhamnose 3,5-epimerase [uncultured Christiangramia sp.]